MPITNNSSEIPDEFDIIVAGGGSAGCVVAGRLAKADPTLKILVVEHGINNRDYPTVVNPGIFIANLAPGSDTMSFYKGNKTDDLNGREPIVPIGGALGGSSSVNFMMYTRAQGVDYDSWKTEGWYAKDLIPLLQKTETVHADGEGYDMSIHGSSGPFQVSSGTFKGSGLADDFIAACDQIGIPQAADCQDLKQGHACAKWKMWIDPKTGRRQDAAHVMIHPLLDAGHEGLHVLTEHEVVRVTFDGTRANGVEVTQAKKKQDVLKVTEETSLAASKKTFKAKKTVVVSCGSLSSSRVLERSGVGNKDLLTKLGIDVVSDVPAVGENYQDHHLLLYLYNSKVSPDESLDALLAGRKTLEAVTEELKTTKKSTLGWNSIDAAIKFRPTEEEVKALGPEFQALWEKDFKNEPARPLMLLALVSGFLGDHSAMPEGQYLMLGPYTAYPYSRGHMHIKSADVASEPDFETGFMSHDADIKAQLWAFKKQREIARRMKLCGVPFEAAPQPKYREGSKALKESESGEYEYDEEDDKAIENLIRDNVQTTWHSCGVCAMRPKEDMGVVDGSLNVYGTQGLKVADMSIIPENVGANTYSTALLIGEKAATIIAKELGISA